MPMFCQKNVYSIKNTMLSCRHISSKKRSFSKSTALMYFLLFFYEKTPALMSIFSHRNVISVKSTLYYGAKKSIGYPFFRFFTKKILLSCPHFVKKRSFSKKRSSFAYILSKKTYILSKTMLSGLFFSDFS